MKHGLLRLLMLLAAVGLCAGMILYTRETPLPKTETLTLWYAEGDCDSAAMESLITRCRKETGIQLRATAFADEEKLGAAFDGLTGRAFEAPDLLFCSYVRAAQLDGLAEIAQALPSPDVLAELRPAVGKSFFPIAMRLPVLLVNKELSRNDCGSLESLLSAAGESPFLGCDCAAALLYTEAAALGLQLGGSPERDMENPDIAALYNQLALAAFRGGLVITDDAAAYVRQGQLACAVTSSTALAGLDGKTLEVRLLPLPEGAGAQYPAELMGFALLGGSDAAETFLQWLWNGRGAEAASEAGMAPLMRGGTERRADGNLGGRLDALTEEALLYLPDADEPFFQNREAYERWLREALDLLA